MRRALLVLPLLFLAACAGQPAVQEGEALSTRAFTAAPGDVMVLVLDPTAFGDDPAPGEVTEFVYLGMRSPTEAVFQRRNERLYDGPLRDTVLPEVKVPERAEVTATDGSFIASTPGATPDGKALKAELVVNPVAGAQFGVDDKAITVFEVTPGRVSYRIERL